MQELPQERLIIADMGIASCEWMFEETRNYVRQRKAFGKTISNLQVCIFCEANVTSIKKSLLINYFLKLRLMFMHAFFKINK